MQLNSRFTEPGVDRTPRPLPFFPALAESASAAHSAVVENPTASGWSLSRSKRVLDFTVAAFVLAAFALPMLAIAICIRCTSSGPVVFAQKRVGRRGRHFSIYKFRSMATGARFGAGPGLTTDGDRRVTGVGRWLRKLKLDELPQFYNILRGDMSLVGPRPKLPQYVGIMNMPYRPGITGAATLAFRREEEILSRVNPQHMESFYFKRIRPLKARIDARYMCRATFRSDMRIIASTFLACAFPARTPAALRTRSAQAFAFRPVQIMEGFPDDSLETSN